MICDFAEFYHITDLKALPVSTLAALSFGLPAESRTMRRLSGSKLTVQETLLAIIADRLGILIWQQTKDGQKGKNQPASILSGLTKEEEKPMTYKDGAAFLAARQSIIGGESDSD